MYCSFAVNMASDYVLAECKAECIDKEKGGPYLPHGTIRSQAAAPGMYDAYNEFVPPSWGHSIAKKKEDQNLFGWTDKLIE